MPLKLIPPRPGKTPFWSVRGTYLGCYSNRSSGSCEKAYAQRFLAKVKRDIESGVLSGKEVVGFAKAASAYVKAGGEGTYLDPLIRHFAATPLADITQVMIDDAAATLYPNATAATRNREVYTPISAVLKRAGDERKIKRPKGWRGQKLTHWLPPHQALAILDAAGRIDVPEKTRRAFQVYLTMLCYTGMRMSEPLRLLKSDIDLKNHTALLKTSKNGKPRLAYLPPVVIEAIEDNLMHTPPSGDRLFSFHAGGRLHAMFKQTLKAASVTLPRGVAFHVFCHTWATWMRQYGGLDTYDLLKTDRWSDAESADRYSHVVASEQALRADLLPGAKGKVA
jgi:integrase